MITRSIKIDFYSTDGMDVVIQNSVLDVQLSLEDSLEKVLKARGHDFSSKTSAWKMPADFLFKLAIAPDLTSRLQLLKFRKNR